MAEGLLNVTDVKQYFYCPRIVYFDKVLHLPQKVLSQQEESRRRHAEMGRREARRKGAVFYDKTLDEAEKFFQVPLASEAYGLKGVLDCLVKAGDEYIPVDYKYQASDRGRVHLRHKYQLVGYAMLVDENFNTTVRRGYVYYVPEAKPLKVEITFELKRFLRGVLRRITEMTEAGVAPDVKACPAACGYEWACDAYALFHGDAKRSKRPPPASFQRV